MSEGRIRPFRVRGVLRRGGLLGLFVDDVLCIGDPAIPAPNLAADHVARLFQLLQGIAHSLYALFADGGEAPRGIVPFLRHGEHHGQQSLGL